MQVSGPFESRTGGSAKASALLSRVIEKSSASSQLDSGPHDPNHQQEKPPPRLQVELLCQDETPRFDPLWDAPRLLPSFVAQVLGQAMPERRQADARLHTAYASADARFGLLVDRRS